MQPASRLGEWPDKLSAGLCSSLTADKNYLDNAPLD
jgi:hypothetical protein